MKKLLYNGFFYRKGNAPARSVLINGPSIEQVDPEQESTTNVERVDMQGRWILPGFEDAHTHPIGRARTLSELDLRDRNISWQEAKTLIAERAAAYPPDSWVVCHGWDNKKWPLTRKDLDAITTNRGIFLINISYHGAIMNGKALEILRSLNIAVDDNVGFLSEADFEKVFIITSPDVQTYLRVLPEYHKKLLASGITAAHDMNVTTFDELEAYKQLDINGDLKVHTLIYLNPLLLEDQERLLPYINYSGNNLEVTGVKLFLDGAIGTHTAALSHDYEDESGRGILRMTFEDCEETIRKASGLGLRSVAMHCIGDQAVDLASRVLKELKQEYPKIVSWRFEHYEITTDESIRILSEFGGIASMQPNFSWDIEHYENRLGERVQQINQFRKIVDSGVKLALGSDDMPSGPIEGIIWATSKAPSPNQKLTVEEAFEAYAHTPAVVVGASSKRGLIDAGYDASFAVFKDSPIEKLSLENNVIETWSKGRKIF